MKKYPFLLFLNIADVNIFLEIQKMRGYPHFFVDSNSERKYIRNWPLPTGAFQDQCKRVLASDCKDLLILRCYYMAQKPLYLKGLVPLFCSVVFH